MPTKDPRVDDYIENAQDFAKPILKHLRQLVHEACPGVEETIKWQFPHFMHKGILCSMAGFNQHCAFGFWKHKLFISEEASQGKTEEAMGQLGRLTSLGDLPSDKILLGYIKEAVRANELGLPKPQSPKPRVAPKLTVPPELATALKKNKKALEAFERFSPSHKKEYIEWITEAKREETRTKRLATTLALLTEGKPRHWKYQNC